METDILLKEDYSHFCNSICSKEGVNEKNINNPVWSLESSKKVFKRILDPHHASAISMLIHISSKE